jgi:two-component system, chemotaxis family, chemotaxis protein CheY
VRVLVVDDSRAMRMIIRRELLSGVAVDDIVEADSGASALASVRAGGIDLVLSDWNMPEMSGIELLEHLRDEGWMGPLGFITSEIGLTTRSRAYSAGAAFVVAKPFTGNSLTQQVIQTLGWSLLAGSGPTFDNGEATLASCLEDFLQRPVSATPSGPPRREVARAVAHYVDDRGTRVGVCISEVAFAAAAGAALSMTQPDMAAEWAAAGVLTEAIAQQYYGVADALAGVINPGGSRCTLSALEVLADFQRPADHQWLAEVPTQRNLEVRVEGYGAGRLALIALEEAEPVGAGTTR